MISKGTKNHNHKTRGRHKSICDALKMTTCNIQHNLFIYLLLQLTKVHTRVC